MVLALDRQACTSDVSFESWRSPPELVQGSQRVMYNGVCCHGPGQNPVKITWGEIIHITGPKISTSN